MTAAIKTTLGAEPEDEAQFTFTIGARSTLAVLVGAPSCVASCVASRAAETVAAVKIPLETLSADALTGIIETFVLREGTDYGERVYDLHAKCAMVRRQLERGEAVIEFDPRTKSVDIRATSGDAQ